MWNKPVTYQGRRQCLGMATLSSLLRASHLSLKLGFQSFLAMPLDRYKCLPVRMHNQFLLAEVSMWFTCVSYCKFPGTYRIQSAELSKWMWLTSTTWHSLGWFILYTSTKVCWRAQCVLSRPWSCASHISSGLFQSRSALLIGAWNTIGCCSITSGESKNDLQLPLSVD